MGFGCHGRYESGELRDSGVVAEMADAGREFGVEWLANMCSDVLVALAGFGRVGIRVPVLRGEWIR